MEIIAAILMGIGGIIAFIGNIMMLIEIFKSGLLWLLGSLLIPFVSLIWLVTHWEDGKRPFGISLSGVLLIFLGLFLSPAS